MMPVLLALTAALLALGFVIGRTIVAQQDARAQAMAEGDALLALQNLMAGLRDAETGQRGFLLTRNAAYLRPYEEGLRRLEPDVAAVREALGRSPDPEAADERRLDRIADIARGKYDEIDRTIALSRAGLQDQAMAIVQSDIGKLQMDAIRGQIAAMSADRAARRRNAFARVEKLENLLLPLIAVLGAAILALVVAGFRAERSRAQVTAAAEQADQLREANARAQLLARELNHRVKNLFAVILSIVTLSGRKQAPAHEIVEDIRARVHALSRAHAASQGATESDAVRLGDTIRQTMEPYADADGRRVRVSGPDLDLPVRMVTPIGLIVHELATNAAKYGALSGENGCVEIAWAVDGEEPDGRRVRLDWIETGGPPLSGGENGPSGQGFGSRMTTLAASQLGGTIRREWPPSGATARITFMLP